MRLEFDPKCLKVNDFSRFANHWPRCAEPTSSPDAARRCCECQGAVDGLINEPLVELLQGLPWPPSDETYLYKQLFVLRNPTRQ